MYSFSYSSFDVFHSFTNLHRNYEYQLHLCAIVSVVVYRNYEYQLHLCAIVSVVVYRNYEYQLHLCAIVSFVVFTRKFFRRTPETDQMPSSLSPRPVQHNPWKKRVLRP